MTVLAADSSIFVMNVQLGVLPGAQFPRSFDCGLLGVEEVDALDKPLCVTCHTALELGRT